MFRLRGWLPLVALLELPLVFGGGAPGARVLPAHAGIAFEVACVALGLAGLAVRFAVVGSVAPGSSGRNTRRQRAHALNTTGAYSVVRNPLYLANFLCWASVSLLLRDPLWIAVNGLLFFAFYLPIVYREEAFLEQEFGEDYRRYAARVPCLIPRPSLRSSTELPFCLRRALRREHDGLLSLAAALVAVDVAYHLLVPGAGPLELAWPFGLALTGAVWAALKLAKKRTSWLAPQEAGGAAG